MKRIQLPFIKNRTFFCCAAGTVLLAAGVTFLPRYLSRSLDLQKLGRVTISDRDSFSFLETSASGVLDAVRAFQKLNDASSELQLTSSYEDARKLNSQLAEKVYDQVVLASDLGMLPYIGSREYEYLDRLGLPADPLSYWPGDFLKKAEYYTFTYEPEAGSHTKKMLNFWYLHFSDGRNFEYDFVVGAANFQIYYVQVHNLLTDILVDGHSLYFGFPESSDGLERPEEEEALSWDGSLNVAGDTALLDLLYEMQDAFAYGCAAYYGADEYRLTQLDHYPGKLILTPILFAGEVAYVEQLALPPNSLGYRGISIGFQNLGPDLQSLMKK